MVNKCPCDWQPCLLPSLTSNYMYLVLYSHKKDVTTKNYWLNLKQYSSFFITVSVFCYRSLVFTKNIQRHGNYSGFKNKKCSYPESNTVMMHTSILIKVGICKFKSISKSISYLNCIECVFKGFGQFCFIGNWNFQVCSFLQVCFRYSSRVRLSSWDVIQCFYLHNSEFS